MQAAKFSVQQVVVLDKIHDGQTYHLRFHRYALFSCIIIGHKQTGNTHTIQQQQQQQVAASTAERYGLTALVMMKFG